MLIFALFDSCPRTNGRTDRWTDRGTDGGTDGQTLLQRCEDASKKKGKKKKGKKKEEGDGGDDDDIKDDFGIWAAAPTGKSPVGHSNFRPPDSISS